MKPASTGLSELISTIPDKEREYVKAILKLNCNGSTNLCIELFDAICSMKTYDEAALKKRFGEKSFRQTKYKLKNKILDALVPINNSFGSKLRTKLNHADILIQRGLYSDAKQTLEQLETQIKTSVNALGSAELHSALSMKSALLSRLNSDNPGNAMHHIGTGIIHNLDNMKLSMEFYYNYLFLAEMVHTNLHIRDKERDEQLKKMEDYYDNLNFDGSKSYDQIMYFQLGHSALAHLLADFCSYQAFEQMVFNHIYARIEEYTAKDPSMLGNSFNGFSFSSFKFRDIPALRHAINTARPVYEKLFINDPLFYGDFLFANCALAYLENDNEKLSVNVRDLWQHKNLHAPRLPKFMLIYIKYMIIIGSHKTGDLDTAKKECVALNLLNGKPEVAGDILEFSLLFRIIIEYDLQRANPGKEADKHLPKYINSFRDSVRKQFKDIRLETAITKAILKALDATGKEKKKAFQQLKEELMELEKQNIQYVNQMFSKFNFIGWAERKSLL